MPCVECHQILAQTFFFFPVKVLLWPLLQQGGNKNKSRLPCLSPEGRQACSLCEGRVGMCPGVRLKGGLGLGLGLAHPIGSIVCSILLLLLHPLFLLLVLQNWQFWVFWSLCVFVQNLPQLHMHAVIFSFIQFLCILLLRRSPDASIAALQQTVPGPRLSHSSLRDSASLFFRVKGLKVSSSETPSCWTGTTWPSLFILFG